MSIEGAIKLNTAGAPQEGVDYKIEISKKGGLWMSLDRFYARFESRLDSLGYSSFNGSASAIFLRLPLALGQGAVAAAGIVGESAITTLCLVTLQTEAAKRHLYGTGHCVRHLTHSVLNIGRVFLEFIPFVPWFTCLPYDSVGKILSYPGALEEMKIVYLGPKKTA